MTYRIVSLLLLVLAVTNARGASDIWSELSRGGYVILMRHGMVDNLSASTSPDADFEGCVGQYNLTELGRAQSLLLGHVLKSRKVPIGGVLTSPLCRTQDTARIAFGQFRAWPLLEPLPESDATERANRIDAITRVIGEFKGPDNLVLITHQPNIDALTLEVVEPATLVVLKPTGTGFRVARVIPAKEWSAVNR